MMPNYTRKDYEGLSKQLRNLVDSNISRLDYDAQRQIDRELQSRYDDEEDFTPGGWESYLEEDLQGRTSKTRAMYLDPARRKSFRGSGYDVEDEMRFLNSIGQLDLSPPAPKKVAPPPTPKVDTIQQTYQKQISDLTKQIETIQKTPPKANVPPPKPPTTPYSVRTNPISLSNPYKSKTLGGIGQFKQKAQSGLATIKSKLINI